MIKKALLLMMATVFGLLLAGCADQKQSLQVGSKSFTESMVLAEMIAQLSENAGITVERHIPYGGTNQTMEATKQGVIDIYPEYNGTALVFLGQAPTNDGDESTKIVQQLFNPLGIEMSGKFGFPSDYAIVTTGEWSEENGVTSIGDLADLDIPLNFAIDSDFVQRAADGLSPLLRRYGLTANSSTTFPLGTEGKDQIVSGLLDGSFNVAQLFFTDGQIAEYNLVVLEDDLQFFPVYEAVPLVRSDALQTFPELSAVLDKLTGLITVEDMQQMNKAVDLEAQTPASVASAFLAGKGLLPEDAASADVESLVVVGDPALSSRNSEIAQALRALRAGFPGKNLELLNSPDPIAALASGEARLAIVGTEAFFMSGDSGPVARGSSLAFAGLGHKNGHLFARTVGANNDLPSMKRIATDQAGSGSAVVLEMLISSLGRSDVEVVYEQKNVTDQVDGLRKGDYDGVFRMATNGDREIASALQAGGVHLLGLEDWAQGGHTARYSFIRPTTIPFDTYPSQFLSVPSVSTQLVLAGPIETQQETGEVGPGTAGVATQTVPVTADAVMAIREALGTAEVIDPAVPVHSALIPSVEVVDKSLPFRLDVSIINILIILFMGWVLYVCYLPSPRTLTMPGDDESHAGK